jgi:hypothetical protein
MTEQGGFPPQDYGQPQGVPYVPPEQQLPADEAQAIAAAQIAAAAGSVPTADAGPTIEQIRQQVARDVLLPMEQQMDSLMAAQKQQAAQLAALLAQNTALSAQLAGAQANLGPPAVVKYSQAVRDRLESARNATGPVEHFAAPLALADQLQAAAREAVTSGDGAKIHAVITDLEKWITRTRHPVRAEHLSTVQSDLADLADAADQIVVLPSLPAASAGTSLEAVPSGELAAFRAYQAAQKAAQG